jgi:PAS domain S-box-containing protein
VLTQETLPGVLLIFLWVSVMIEHRTDTVESKDIVVVDDSVDSLQLLVDILKKKGYRTRPATSGELALSAITVKRPDLILLDVKMPGMDGYEVCRRLKSNPEYSGIAIIFISALDQPEDKVRAFAAGGVDYITKPLNCEEVLARVQTHLRLQELTERLEQRVVKRTAALTEANRKLHEALEARKRDNALINMRLKLMQHTANHGFDELMQASLDEVEKLTESKISFYHILAGDQKRLTLTAWSTRTEKKYCDIKLLGGHCDIDRAGVWGDCVRERKPVIHNDYKSLPHKKGLPDGHVDLLRQLAVPIFRHDKIVSILGLGNKASDYTRQDVQTATYCGDIVWGIAERKQAQEALRQSDNRFRRLFQQAPIALMIVDASGRVQHLNDRFTEFYGYTHEDIPTLDAFWPAAYPETWRKDGTPDLWSESRRLVRTSGKTSEPLVSDIMCKNGQVRTIEISAISLGNLLLTSWVDLTEQKRVQDEINQRKQFLELVLNHLPDAIVTLDPDHRVVDWNPGAQKVFGYTPEEAIGKSLNHLVALDRAIDEAGRQSQLLSGKAVKPFETVRYHQEGIPLNVIAAGYPIMRDDVLTGVVAVYTDISKQRKMEDERKEYETRIQQMQKMEAIGTLAGGIAHDFNNILSGVIGYAELSLAETLPGTPLHRNLRQILTGGRRAGDLVRQILTFSRQNERELKLLHIGPMLKEALKLLRSSLPTTIQISKYISPGVDNVMADPTQIHQIIMNLCTNAAQAMHPNGGRLEIQLVQKVLEEQDVITQPTIAPGPFAKISVEDTGKGILPEHIDKIFNPYFTTKMTGEGTGLGLAMVHGIVQSYRGFINVDSTPGQGTRFDVYIPTVESAQSHEAPEEMDLPTGHEHILVVDDEKVLVEVISGMLTYMGYRVTTTNSSNEALGKFAATPADFDLVLTDMTMPDLTGIQLSRRLTEIRPDIPIVLCTGYSHQVSNQHPEELGLKAIVMKPVQTSELARTIRKVLDTTAS